MKKNLQFDFLTDKKKNTLTIRREFKASRQLIWDAYAKSELLEQWFAPKPLNTKTKSMDFRNGGHWIYAMVEPDGKEHWGRTDYLEIEPINRYTALDAFCDENGEINSDLPRANWDVCFSDWGSNVMVETIVTYKSLKDLESIIQMGMQEGLASAMERLDELISKIK